MNHLMPHAAAALKTGLALGLVAGLGCLSAPSSLAQAPRPADAWPARPVTIIIPFTAGGSTELEFRVYANKLTDNIGRPFVLDYKPGAGTLVGNAFVAKAPPDGYTLLGTTSSYSAVPSLYPGLPYDPVKDLAPVSQMSSKSSLLVSHPAVPAANAREFFAWAKAVPGRLNHSTSGAGGGPHLRAEYLYKLMGVQATFVHYKGTGPMTLDLVAGRVHSAMTLPTLVMSYIHAGKLRALGSTGAQRNPLTPQLPTLMEQGATSFDYSAWAGMFAPGATPVALVNRLHAELVKVARAPEVIAKLAEDGNDMVAGTPEQLRRLVIADIELTRRMVQETGIKLEQ